MSLVPRQEKRREFAKDVAPKQKERGRGSGRGKNSPKVCNVNVKR